MRPLLGLLCALACAATARAEAQVVANDGWSLAWQDEFDGTALDPKKWRAEVDCWGGGNDERQCYTDRPDNASVADGVLTITARKQKTRGPALPLDQRKTPADSENMIVKPYSSARLTTNGLADWRYGRIEVRARLPEGQGLWPAIWMLPSERHYGAWAASGEIDIMEAVNLGTACDTCTGGRENHVLGTLHFGGVWPNNVFASHQTQMAPSADGFHIFAIVWTADRIEWFVDGSAYASAPARSWFSGSPDMAKPGPPFDRAFHLIVNLAVGGRLPEGRNLKGVSEKGLPAQFQIDWVRVYQCAAVTDGGTRCTA